MERERIRERLSRLIAKAGEKEGHKFRGNQWTHGIPGGPKEPPRPAYIKAIKPAAKPHSPAAAEPSKVSAPTAEKAKPKKRPTKKVKEPTAKAPTKTTAPAAKRVKKPKADARVSTALDEVIGERSKGIAQSTLALSDFIRDAEGALYDPSNYKAQAKASAAAASTIESAIVAKCSAEDLVKASQNVLTYTDEYGVNGTYTMLHEYQTDKEHAVFRYDPKSNEIYTVVPSDGKPYRDAVKDKNSAKAKDDAAVSAMFAKKLRLDIESAWKESSDGSPLSLALQESAAKLFGLKGARPAFGKSSSAYEDPEERRRIKDGAKSLHQYSQPLLDAYLQGQYDATQKFFKDAGITEVALVRGELIDNTVLASPNKYKSKPLSSWTVIPYIAQDFADQFSAKQHHLNAAMAYAVVPATKILSAAGLGMGSANKDSDIGAEGEVVVLGGSNDHVTFTINESGKPEKVAAAERKRRDHVQQLADAYFAKADPDWQAISDNWLQSMHWSVTIDGKPFTTLAQAEAKYGDRTDAFLKRAMSLPGAQRMPKQLHDEITSRLGQRVAKRGDLPGHQFRGNQWTGGRPGNGARRVRRSEDRMFDHLSSDRLENAMRLRDAIIAGKKVILTKAQASLVISELGKWAAAERRKQDADPGYKPKNINLCNITVPRTNVFCEGNRGMDRIKMPQFVAMTKPGSEAEKYAKQHPELVVHDQRAGGDVLDASKVFEKVLGDRGVRISSTSMPVGKLKATQRELKGVQVLDMMNDLLKGEAANATPHDKAAADSVLQHPIYVTRDGYVLDGHHRFAAIVASDYVAGHQGNTSMPVRLIDAPIEQVLPLAIDWTDQFGMTKQSAKVKKSVRADHRNAYVRMDAMNQRIIKSALERALVSKERQGHPFRGNQWTHGIPGGGPPHGLSGGGLPRGGTSHPPVTVQHGGRTYTSSPRLSHKYGKGEIHSHDVYVSRAKGPIGQVIAANTDGGPMRYSPTFGNTGANKWRGKRLVTSGSMEEAVTQIAQAHRDRLDAAKARRTASRSTSATSEPHALTVDGTVVATTRHVDASAPHGFVRGVKTEMTTRTGTRGGPSYNVRTDAGSLIGHVDTSEGGRKRHYASINEGGKVKLIGVHDTHIGAVKAVKEHTDYKPTTAAGANALLVPNGRNAYTVGHGSKKFGKPIGKVVKFGKDQWVGTHHGVNGEVHVVPHNFSTAQEAANAVQHHHDTSYTDSMRSRMSL